MKPIAVCCAVVLLGFFEFALGHATDTSGSRACKRACTRTGIQPPGSTRIRPTSMLPGGVRASRRRSFLRLVSGCRRQPRGAQAHQPGPPQPVCRPPRFNGAPFATPLAPGPNSFLDCSSKRNPACWVSAWACLQLPGPRHSGSLGLKPNRQNERVLRFLGCARSSGFQFTGVIPATRNREGSAPAARLGKPGHADRA